MRGGSVGGVALAMVAVMLGLALAPGAQASGAQQIVFSAQNPPSTGSFTSGSVTTPFGFWIWCEGASTNPYTGRCGGAMYFYGLAIVRGVQDFAAPTFGTSAVTLHVQSGDGAVHCDLTGPLSPSSGPTNTISVTCMKPSGSGTASNAEVQIT